MTDPVWYVGGDPDLISAPFGKPVEPFEPDTLAFVSALSERLLHHEHPEFESDLRALGFWFRPAHLEKLRGRIQSDDVVLRPIGRVFQVAPGNVEALFLYSGLLALLLGNSVITRVSSHSTPLFEALLDILNALLEETHFQRLKTRFRVVGFGHSEPLFDRISENCDLRILWGSDESVFQVRQRPLKASASELTFASKTSAALFSTQQVGRALREGGEQLSRLVEAFRRDAFSFGQQACNSVKTVVWLEDCGSQDEADAVIGGFWECVSRQQTPLGQDIARANRRISVVQSLAAAGIDPQKMREGCGFSVLSVSELNGEEHRFHEGGGVFLETRFSSLHDALTSFDRRYQTLACFGVDERELALALAAWADGGIARVVPLGRSLDFDILWDGIDLPAAMTRKLGIPLSSVGAPKQEDSL